MRRKAKECRDSHDSHGIIYDKASEGQLSVTTTLTSYSETKTSTIVKQSIIEIREISTETVGLESAESNNDIAAIRVIEEGVHGDSAKNPITPELDLKDTETSSRSTVQCKGPDTPDRPKDSPFTCTASSPLTPTSRGPYRFLENTPDTPESILRPSSETESPSLKRLDSTDHSSALLTAPKPFEHPPLPDNLFGQQNWNSSQNEGLRSRSRRSPVSRKLFPSLEKDIGNTVQPQALFSWTQTEAAGRVSPPQENSIKVESRTLAQVHTSLSEFVTKYGQQHIPPLVNNAIAAEQSSWKNENEGQGTPAKNSPISSLSFQPAPAKPLPNTAIATKTSRFANALEVYDVVVDDSTRKLFETNPRRCFARTLKGERCKRWQINGSKESIRLAIEMLETGDHISDLEGCKKQVKALVNLSLCEAETWPGHISNLNKILFRFEKEVADSLSSGDQTFTSGNLTTNSSASSYSRTTLTNTQAIDTPSNAFTGFERWQPLRIERADVSSCLRELVGIPLDLEKEGKSGYIYAYRTQGIFGFIKIGHTTRDINTRMAEWQAQCWHDPETVLGSNYRVPHVARVEKLIHTELKDFRHKQTKCICGVIHIEWFEVSHLDVAVVVEKWSSWMETNPYYPNGLLKGQHQEWLEELCKPCVLPSKTPRAVVNQYKHVEQLEKRFEFPGNTRYSFI